MTSRFPSPCRIALFEVPAAHEEYLRASPLGAHELRFSSAPVRPPVGDAASCQILSVFIYSRLSADVLSQLPHLVLIATRSTGYDHIDLDYCRARGIKVCNVPSYGENTVAEHTFGLILSLSRNIHRAYLRTSRGNYSLEGLSGFDLKGKAIGVVGTGHIGFHVIRMAKGFGMHVLATDIREQPFLAEVLDFTYVLLTRLLQESDIISLHAPYNASTHHLINRQNIGLIKRGAILINTARGGLIETAALVEALDKGILGGAGLDVLEGEHLIKEEWQLLASDEPVETLRTLLSNHILQNRENVVITPHIAFDSREALLRILDTTVANILHFLQGAPENLVGA